MDQRSEVNKRVSKDFAVKNQDQKGEDKGRKSHPLGIKVCTPIQLSSPREHNDKEVSRRDKPGSNSDKRGKQINLSNAIPVILKVDPITGEKHVLKDGKKYGIVNPPIVLNGKCLQFRHKPRPAVMTRPGQSILKIPPFSTGTTPTFTGTSQPTKRNLVLLRGVRGRRTKLVLSNPVPVPNRVPPVNVRHDLFSKQPESSRGTSPTPTSLPVNPSKATMSSSCGANINKGSVVVETDTTNGEFYDIASNSTKVRKFKKVNRENVSVPPSSDTVATDVNLTSKMKNSVVLQEKDVQTDTVCKQDSSTQTDPIETPDPIDGRGSPFLPRDLFNFILEDSEVGFFDLVRSNMQSRSIVMEAISSAARPRTKEEIDKFNFFNDLRSALNRRAGNLPIHDSVMQNNCAAVRKHCIILRALKKSVDIPNHQNYTPLHLAILQNVSEEVVTTLFEFGADISVVETTDGNTPLHMAVDCNRFGLLRTLLNHSRTIGFCLDVFNYDGLTPLMMSCCSRSFDMTKLFIMFGADPNVKDRKSGRTALFHAAECHDESIVQLLIENRADTKIRNFFGTSPHDAMFELEDMPSPIKTLILGREPLKVPTKRKTEPPIVLKTRVRHLTPEKKVKLEMKQVLRKVLSSELQQKLPPMTKKK